MTTQGDISARNLSSNFIINPAKYWNEKQRLQLICFGVLATTGCFYNILDIIWFSDFTFIHQMTFMQSNFDDLETFHPVNVDSRMIEDYTLAPTRSVDIPLAA